MISHEMSDDISSLYAKVAGGWGLHSVRSVANGQWSRAKSELIATMRLSISPLELLTASAVVVLLGNMCSIPYSLSVVLRCDNALPYIMANTGGAHSPSMRFTLRKFVVVCE